MDNENRLRFIRSREKTRKRNAKIMETLGTRLPVFTRALFRSMSDEALEEYRQISEGSGGPANIQLRRELRRRGMDKPKT